jgi:molecular chaperone DnaJ
VKDYYEILGVGRDATQEDIKKAFRAKAKEFHPDVAPASEKKAAEDKFKAISESYDVIGDESKRREYDSRRAFGPHSFGVSFEDFFSNRPTKGADIRGSIDVTLEDVVYGSKKNVSVRRMSSCRQCGGSGSSDGQKETCRSCGGLGAISKEVGNSFFRCSTHIPCGACGGRGQAPQNPCSSCNGGGRGFIDDNVEVDIRAGFRSGESITIPSKGSWGPLGDGDLFVTIRVMPHDRFSRNGNDLITTIDVPLLTALSGGEVLLSGMKGEVIRVVVPKPCQHGQEVVVPMAGINGYSVRAKVKFSIPPLNDDDLLKLSGILV